MRKVGLIGLGLLGTALAHRFLQFGNRVMGYDLAESQRSALTRAGGHSADSALEVAEHCDDLVLSLPNSDIVAEVIRSIESALRPGQLVIDTTTGEPADAAALGAKLATRHIPFIDATIAGSSAQVSAGEAIVMAGGETDSVAKAQPLFDCFAREVFRVGPWGSGARMKLVVNLVLGLNRAVLAEGLALARALELDPQLVLTVLMAGPAYSQVMETKGHKMLTADFTPQAKLSQHLKDVGLILAAAARTKLELPLSAVHRQLLEQVVASGAGELDNCAIIRAFTSQPTSELDADERDKPA